MNIYCKALYGENWKRRYINKVLLLSCSMQLNFESPQDLKEELIISNAIFIVHVATDV